MPTQQQTTVLEVSGVHWASEKAVAEAVLGRRPGVLSVEANPVSQTATVTYDPSRTSVAELAAWVRDCGYHCAGQSVPQHVCDPAAEPHHVGAHDGHRPAASAATHDHAAMTVPAAQSGGEHAGHGQHEGHGEHAGMTPQDAMGHGGHHAGMSMDDMARDMRNRFLVAALLSIPILLWSPIGREVIGF
ncbi:heavy-metal-associated domain-containing protein, partial [Blastococcus sp. TF02A-35]|uniref:heavy-metal-associated domain-containing protein n=1 Tax=Blastococcus sp. TF02A-35 TaxID=2559612 RepID=UPI001073C4A3